MLKFFIKVIKILLIILIIISLLFQVSFHHILRCNLIVIDFETPLKTRLNIISLI